MIAPRKSRNTSLRSAVRVSAGLAFAAAALSACEKPPNPELVSSAKFGVFFGGQIEERRDVPFELDPSKQTEGFRIQFSNRLASDVEIAWTIDLPGPGATKATRLKTAHPQEPHRRHIVGKATARAGTSTFDQMTAFEPGDPLGLWNARVVVQGKVVLDRPFEVYDPSERARAASSDAGTR